eukprot:6514116-Alexandrium_andersonii.AAC.1
MLYRASPKPSNGKLRARCAECANRPSPKPDQQGHRQPLRFPREKAISRFLCPPPAASRY